MIIPVPPDPVRLGGEPRPDPVCPVHGPMRFDMAFDWWRCPGWDSEGCSQITAEEWFRGRPG